MKTIEEQLWDYIDGNLSISETKIIEDKINSDADFKLLYKELLNLDLSFSKVELDEPSMSFTRNVMESVALEAAPVAMKTKVNTSIIYGIGGFFIVSLMAIFGYVLFNADIKFSDLDLKLNTDFNLDKYITPTMLYSFLFADLVLGLVFIDYLLRKKIAHR